MLETGEEFFLSRGYAGVGLRDLLEAVGTSKGGFYHFFASKEAFALAVLERHARRREAAMEEAFAGATGLADLLAWFRADWQAQVAADYVPRCLAGRFAPEVSAGFPIAPVRQALDAAAEILASAVAAGQAAGWIYPELNPAAAARHLADLWHGATARALVERDDAAPKAALAHMEAWLKP